MHEGRVRGYELERTRRRRRRQPRSRAAPLRGEDERRARLVGAVHRLALEQELVGVGESERRESGLRLAVVFGGCRSQDARRVDADQPAGAVAVDLGEPLRAARCRRSRRRAASSASRAGRRSRPPSSPSGVCQR